MTAGFCLHCEQDTTYGNTALMVDEATPICWNCLGEDAPTAIGFLDRGDIRGLRAFLKARNKAS